MKRIAASALISVALSMLILSACSGAGASLDGTSWTLTSYRNTSDEIVQVLPRRASTAHFQASQVSGLAGCNNYSASYSAKATTISFGAVTTTRKVCSSLPGIGQQESAFLAGLASAASYKLGVNTLEIYDGRRNTLLTFRRSTE